MSGRGGGKMLTQIYIHTRYLSGREGRAAQPPSELRHFAMAFTE